MPHLSAPPVTSLDRYLKVVSGEASGFFATAARAVLTLAAVPYAVVVRGRNLAFDAELLRSHRAPVPVISLGNLTTGGTGKTPLAAFLAQWFQSRNLKPAFLSRGYHAGADLKNDEALVLEKLCPGVLHVQQPDRVAGASLAVMSGAEVLILDDGFQHRRLQRDLNILVIDAVQPWGYGSLLPRGLLREPLHSARRADLVVMTRANLVPEQQRQAIRDRLEQHGCRAPQVQIAFLPAGLVNSAGEKLPLEKLQGKKPALLCGIGNPQGFLETVKSQGIDFSELPLRTFPDHHHYSTGDLATIAEWGRSLNADIFLTTLKDLVKIPHRDLSGIPLWALDIRPVVLQGDDELNRLLERIAELSRGKKS